MIFALSNDDRTLHVFGNESEAVAYAEGIDVAEGVWAFYGETGEAMEAVFTTPNQKSCFSVTSGKYHLRASNSSSASTLASQLASVATVEGVLSSIEAVQKVLTSASSRRADARVLS